jgi:hypothetical protein
MAGMIGVKVIVSELVWVIRNEEHARTFKSKVYRVDPNWHGINPAEKTTN